MRAISLTTPTFSRTPSQNGERNAGRRTARGERNSSSSQVSWHRSCAFASTIHGCSTCPRNTRLHGGEKCDSSRTMRFRLVFAFFHFYHFSFVSSRGVLARFPPPCIFIIYTYLFIYLFTYNMFVNADFTARKHRRSATCQYILLFLSIPLSILDIQALQIALLANYIRHCLSFIYHRLYHVLEI